MSQIDLFKNFFRVNSDLEGKICLDPFMGQIVLFKNFFHVNFDPRGKIFLDPFYGSSRSV